jgi:hypothetical protein
VEAAASGEFVIQTSPGGGSDQYARMWIGIIEKLKLSPVPIIPVNKPGGAGAVTAAYLVSKKGDGHFISPTLNSVVTTPLLQKIPVMYPSRDLTPLAMMATDPFLLVVNREVFKSWEEFHKACKERTLTAVGTGSQSGGRDPDLHDPAGGGLPAVPLRAGRGRRRRRDAGGRQACRLQRQPACRVPAALSRAADPDPVVPEAARRRLSRRRPRTTRRS